MHAHTVQLNLNFTHACRYTRVLARLMHAKLQKLACAHRIANTCDTQEMHVTSLHFVCHARYTCGVTTGTVAVGNEIQLLAAVYVVMSIA